MIRISSTPALIGINNTPGKLNIHQSGPNVSMHTDHTKVEIHNEQLKVNIDQYQCFAEAGLKNYLDLTKEAANKGKQKVMQGIGRRVSQGNELATIENGGNVIARQAEVNAFELFNKSFSYGIIPKSRPQIFFEGGHADIKHHKGKVSHDSEKNDPIINFQRGKVDFYIRQKNNVDIEYVGNKFDKQI